MSPCNPRKGVALSPISQCSSYLKGSLQVTVDYSQPTYFFLSNTNNLNMVSSNHSYAVIWFGFVLFNGISTFVGYLMLKPSF